MGIYQQYRRMAMAIIAAVLTPMVGQLSAVGATPLPAAGVPPRPLSGHVTFGAAVPDLPYGRADLPALESELGAHLGIASSFVDWSYVIGGANERWMAAGGSRRVLLAWEPTGVRFTDVTSHAEDAYLRQVAESMKAFPYDVYVRPWPEMNAGWSRWQPTPDGRAPDGGTPAEFIAAWRYLVDFMRQEGSTHLKFVFNPDASQWPVNTPISAIWPGTAYVDVLGIDGYNWGNSATGAIDSGDRWRSFDSIFGPMYKTLTHLHPSAPVWITEVGSKEPAVEDDALYPAQSSPADRSNSKADWIAAMMSSTSFPRVQAVAWFDFHKERDWRLDSSPAALATIRGYLSADAGDRRTPPVVRPGRGQGTISTRSRRGWTVTRSLEPMRTILGRLPDRA